LRVVECNSAAIRLYEAADFRLEGRLVRHAYRNGELHDVLVFGWEAMDASDSTTPET
jgi:RimJ/RimL family protein N-acetyltransferase